MRIKILNEVFSLFMQQSFSGMILPGRMGVFVAWKSPPKGRFAGRNCAFVLGVFVKLEVSSSFLKFMEVSLVRSALNR